MTFRDYLKQAINEDIEFDAVIGDVDMPATYGFCEGMTFTKYCEEKYGDLLDSEIKIYHDPTGRYTDTVEVMYDDADKGEKFTWAVAGYVSETEFEKLFGIQ